MNREIERNPPSGILAAFILLAAELGLIYFLVEALARGNIVQFISVLLLIIVVTICWRGLFMVQPNEGKVLQLFGAYRGTAYVPGLRFTNPFYSRRAVSVRIRNFESGTLKVNDNSGSPIEIAAVVVWKVVDTAEAVFEVDNFEEFVSIQSEAALRNLASSYPYDTDNEDEPSLRSHTQAMSDSLRGEIQDRLDKAGVEVIEARISHLAYAPEIAQAMLRRQQAGAIIAARTRIVEGAVGMVEMALEELSRKQLVALDEERKAAMVSNLLVVLCSEEHTQPIINTGSLY